MRVSAKAEDNVDVGNGNGELVSRAILYSRVECMFIYNRPSER